MDTRSIFERMPYKVCKCFDMCNRIRFDKLIEWNHCMCKQMILKKKKPKGIENLNCDIGINRKNIFLRKKHDIDVSKQG